MLLSHHGVYTQKLRKEAAVYQIDLHLKTTILYIKDMDLEHEKSKLMLLYPTFLIEEGTYILLIQNQTNIDQVVQSLLRNQQLGAIAIGNFESNIGRSYHQAKSTMQVMAALNLPSRVTTYEEVAFLIRLSEMQPLDKANVISKLEDIPDMLETLQCFINHDCSVSATAAELNIHRNTLQYRLKRIHDRTGKDPRNVLQLFELTHSLLSFYR
ncbi:PucR family transcriptional regulator [Paenibacillus guangzhouensis]|uniref:PucR family transcriptional regulator n=1 Tax=Paenibacillus guangzhouensis TaxID=1473112 RepID=UPI001D1107B8|nr:helix-turn-helix domain-containing protein [Paenibacillus guangzhouensis]